MAPPPPAQGLALRPWPVPTKKPKNIAEFIARVNAERGGFRNLTTELLQREIEERQNSGGGGDGNGSKDVEMGDASEEEDDGTVTVEPTRAGREEGLRSLEVAHHAAMIGVDFVSLLLSKDLPVQAITTLSPKLREMVGIGTLSAYPVIASNLTDEVLRAQKTVAVGWKFLAVEKTANSFASNIERLHNEIEVESRYWNEVLAVSDQGWAVSRLPYDRHAFGVKFGFSEAAAGFRHNISAPMRRGVGGAVELDTSRVGRSQRICVMIEKKGKVIGKSSLPKPLPANASLQERILEARNTIFAQELWHEINREGRSLLSYGVKLLASAVTIQVTEDTSYVITLRGLEEGDAPADSSGGPSLEDLTAQAISSTLHVLLSNAHRQNKQRRSQPTPPTATANRTNAPYYLLRPILIHLAHEQSLNKATQFMTDLTDLLHMSGLATPSYSLTEPATSLRGAAPSSRIAASEALFASMMNPREFLFELEITPEARISVRGKTSLAPLSTQYLIQLPPLSAAQTSQETAPVNPLQALYPPAEYYPDLREVTYYIRQATARFLAARAEEVANSDMARMPPLWAGEEQQPEWQTNFNGRALCHISTPFREIRLDICRQGDIDRWDERLERKERPDSLAFANTVLTPELRIYASWPVGDQPIGEVVHQKWAWTVDDIRGGKQVESVMDVIIGCSNGMLRPPES